MSKLTKIVATIGPATEPTAVLEELLAAGMDVARFNTKHSDPKWHAEVIERVRQVADKQNAATAILLDLQGPEIRLLTPGEQSFELAEGETVLITANPNPTQAKSIIVPAEVVAALQPPQNIILADGACELTVTKKIADGVEASAVFACTVKHRKTMNLPGVPLDMPSLTERDLSYLDGVKAELIDLVGLSFVRSAKDITILRQELQKRSIVAGVVAKIENQEALDNLDEIIAAADAIMVARGDLGVEVPYQELIFWQKQIIEKCRQVGKPVITATEMLKSMIESPKPSRAEVSDVAHAIYDGTDAVMLSEETTIGKYPVKAVKVQATIAEYNEGLVDLPIPTVLIEDNTAAITQSALAMLKSNEIGVDKVVCLTETGRTPKLLSRYRPDVPIYAITRNRDTYRQLNLVFGVVPILIGEEHKEVLTEESLLEVCQKYQVIESGEQILLIRGKYWWQKGLTNTLSLLEIP